MRISGTSARFRCRPDPSCNGLSARFRLLLGILLVAAVVLHQPLRRTILAVIRAPLVIVNHITQTVVTLPRLPSLVQENTALRLALAERTQELATLREALRHRERGEGLVAAHPHRGIVASVIGRPTEVTQHVLLLDKGSRDGLSPDGILVDGEGVVGRLIEVHHRTSLGLALTDLESRIACLVERSRESGLLIGTGTGRCRVIYLDGEADIVEGDRLITAGLGGPFPKGLVLGTVRQVFRDRQQMSTWAWCDPAAKLSRLEEVLCLLPSRSSSD